MSERPHPPERPVSENGDLPISSVRINFTDSEVDGRRLGPLVLRDHLHNLRAGLMPDLLICCESGLEAELEAELAAAPADLRARCRPVPVAGPLSPWAQDGSKPVSARRTRICGRNPDANRNRAALTGLAGHAGVSTGDMRLHYDGGDLVVGADVALAGPKTVRDAGRLLADPDPARAVAAIAADLGLEVLIAGADRGGGPLPARVCGLDPVTFHLDLLLALVRDLPSGHEVVLIESPVLAGDLVMDVPGWSGLTAGGMAAVVARRLEDPALEAGDRLFLQLLATTDPAAVRQRERDVAVLAEFLSKNGLEPRLVPGLTMLTDVPLRSPAGVNFTNLLAAPGLAAVPAYGGGRLESYVHAVLAAMGYQALPQPAAATTFRLRGGPRCAAEVYRDPSRAGAAKPDRSKCS